MNFTERVLFDAAQVRETADGYWVADVRVARTGIQLYSGRQTGRPDLATVRVYRPPEEVFADEAMHSFAWRPITDDHPPEMVTASNWKRYARGQVGDEIAQDGKFVRVPMMLMDSAVIDKVRAGKRELSMGYTADLEWGDGITPQGENYDAIQKNIRANHLAVVDAARGGPDLRIGDGEVGDATSLNAAGMRFARSLIQAGKVNKTASWSFSGADGNALLGATGDDWTNYGKHFLGADSSTDATTKAHWKYPFAKNGTLYRSALTAIRQRAGQQGDELDLEDASGPIFEAAGTLLDLVDNQGTQDMNDRTLNLDGLPITVSTEAGHIIDRYVKDHEKLVADHKAETDALNAKVKELTDAATKAETDHKAALEAKDGKIAEMEKQLKDAKAGTEPAAIDALVKDRVAVVDRAKKIGGDKIVTDGKTNAEIRKQAVEIARGADFVKDKSDDYIGAAFDAIEVKDGKGGDRLAAALGDRQPAKDAEEIRNAAYTKSVTDMENAWKGDQPTKQ